MFAVLQASPEVSLDALVEVAQAFTPRFQVVGPFVLLDVGGLSALFGSAEEVGVALLAAEPRCRSVALASTASAAMLLASGRDGLVVLPFGEERAVLAVLPIEVLVMVTEARMAEEDRLGSRACPPKPVTTDGEGGSGAITPAGCGQVSSNGGWRHPRDTHQAQHTHRAPARRVAPVSASDARRSARSSAQSSARAAAVTLRRWGIRTLGALAALPRPEVYERLGELGVSWQRLACGEDDGPLVPWVAEPVFEETLELEWPVEGFEPLSFVLARLFEPLAAALERADRGAVAIRTALGLTTRDVHLRVLPLPAPMRDPKTLRTLVLLDLESHPPAAAVDRVQVRLEPTPGRVVQWTLFERAQPAPEQVATLLARLTALVGEGHVGAPALVESWRPGAFAMDVFGVPGPALPRLAGETARAEADCPGLPRRSSSEMEGERRQVPSALRRFRLPVPVRVRVEEGRPVRLTTDRHGLTGGAIVQSAGPWRTSGEWWAGDTCREWEVGNREASARPVRVPARSTAWDRDEWDIAMADGTVYRLSVEREVGQWYLEGVVD